MNEKREASGKSNKSLLLRLNNLCERKKKFCVGLFSWLSGSIICVHFLYRRRTNVSGNGGTICESLFYRVTIDINWSPSLILQEQ